MRDTKAYKELGSDARSETGVCDTTSDTRQQNPNSEKRAWDPSGETGWRDPATLQTSPTSPPAKQFSCCPGHEGELGPATPGKTSVATGASKKKFR